jgi:hypothetical protein
VFLKRGKKRRVALQSGISRPTMERLWSLAVATSGNRWQMDRPEHGGTKPKPLPLVATSCRKERMVRRGRRFESVRGLAEEPCKWACCVAHDGEILNPRGYGYTLGLAALAYTRDVSWHSLERLGTLDRDRSHATTVSVCCCSTRSPCQSRSPHSL